MEKDLPTSASLIPELSQLCIERDQLLTKGVPQDDSKLLALRQRIKTLQDDITRLKAQGS